MERVTLLICMLEVKCCVLAEVLEGEFKLAFCQINLFCTELNRGSPWKDQLRECVLVIMNVMVVSAALA